MNALNIQFELSEDTILISRQDLKAELKELIKEMQQESSIGSILTIKETAAFMKVSVPTVRTLIANKEIPFFQRGQVIRLNKADVVNWLRKNSNL